ncbi:MAG: HAMP domain-containing histidine kinase [Candidatus Gastranaerophilales bacterium]|nr:HAMP domain-containing histidine kinase [Candidatus Gastranaerophilales bacterium]
MTKIFLLFNNQGAKNQVNSLLLKEQDVELMDSMGELEDVLTQIHHFSPDIILIENSYDNCEFVIRQIKSNAKNQNTQIILLITKQADCNFMNLADGFIEYPLNGAILLSTIDSHFKTKKSLDRLYENNKELSRSLYQLNVLYNTSSQFTGTLNTTKLYDIMIEAMEKTLSFDIASVLIINANAKPVFNLNTMHTPSENLVDALKIRSILNCRTQLEKEANFTSKELENIEIIQKTKQSRSNKIFGIETISYDSLFAPIKIGNEFFGVVELFRQIPFQAEDVTCFQAITHQVALPLRSAKLYEEISITNKKLEKLEKLKSEFVSIVSHELRTPLTPINNSLEIVLNEQAGPLSDDAKNFISMAKRNIQRLSGIIEDLLDLSRIQTGKLDFKYKTVDITPSLELLQRTFLQVANEKSININLDIQDKLPEIYADIRRIEQILSNLVSNALKFTSPDGDINIEANIVNHYEINQENLVSPAVTPDGQYIKISVSDNGIGIKKEDIPKIFDKFSQIESSLKRNNGGVGLGLTITKQLIDSHLGVIEVDSKEQEGSTFSVYLPLVDELKMFEMDLSRALTNNDEVGLIKICAHKELNIIEQLKENKLLNLSKLSREMNIDRGEIIEYFAFIPKISLSSFEALISALNDYCSKIKSDEYAIILTNAHSIRNGADVSNLIKILAED